jgi:energy-coupling factor transport system ATP-binding protein
MNRKHSVQERSHSLGTLLQNVETQIFTDTVFDELAFGLENLNIPSERIALRCEASLREFGLEGQRHWAIRQLSAG